MTGMPPQFYYLSEMSVSPKHGGGITLMRTLGSDLENVGAFFHLTQYGQSVPPAEPYQSRSRYLVNWFETPLCKRLLGWTLSGRIFRSALMQRLHARRCARVIQSQLQKNGSTDTPLFLVSPQSLLAMDTMALLKARLPGLRYITWIMDELFADRDETGQWDHPAAVKPVYQKHLNEANGIIVISEPMRELYCRLYGVDSEVIFSPAPDDSPATVPASPQGKKLAYFGSLHVWPADALERFSEPATSLGYTLCIHSFQRELPQKLQHPGVQLLPPLPPEDIPKQIPLYDGILVPIGFADNLQRSSCFNIPTKMSECLGSGNVTIVIGPENSATVRYVKETQTGITISDTDRAVVSQALEALQDEAQRNAIITRALTHTQGALSQASIHSKWQALKGHAFSPSTLRHNPLPAFSPS